MGVKKRKKIGLIFNFNPSWMGGIIYLINISQILKFLDDDDKPEILIFFPKVLKKFVDEIDYPYLKKIEWEFPSIFKGYLLSKIKRKNVFVHDLIEQYSLDGVYPMHDFPVKSRQKAQQVSWYADLQHKYYPEFFSKRKLLERDLRVKQILKNANDLVVSSQTIKNDFIKFFKIPKTLNIHVYRFVSIINTLPNTPPDVIKAKYSLPKTYFMISNQFHKHKNHKVALEALALLKVENISLHLVMTGSFPKQPDSPYMQELHDIINENQLSPHISFLGLIPREDQLLLMKNAKAIIQPSLYEGWSTVIEDARSLQVPVIATDIPVNIEQLGDRGKYFSPHDFKTLASLIIEQQGIKKVKQLYEPYDSRMKEAAYSFYSIITN